MTKHLFLTNLSISDRKNEKESTCRNLVSSFTLLFFSMKKILATSSQTNGAARIFQPPDDATGFKPTSVELH